MKRRSTTARVTAVGVALALGLSACGEDSDDSTSATDSTTATEAPVESLTVTATEYEFDASATPDADTKSIEFVNDGEEGHVLIVAKINDGFTVDEAVKLEGEKGSGVLVGQGDAGPGKSTTVELKGPLEAGHYAMLCPLQTKDGEDHYKLGQLEEFDIEE